MLSDYRKETISRLQMLNSQLRQFISSQNGANTNMIIDNTPENISQSLCTKAVQQYNRIQVHAKTAHQLLDEYLQPPVCNCPSSHYASLQLEVPVNGPSLNLNMGGRQSQIFLNMMLSAQDLRETPSRCIEILLEGVESQAGFEPRAQSQDRVVIPTPTETYQPAQGPTGVEQKLVVKISIGGHIKTSAKYDITSHSSNMYLLIFDLLRNRKLFTNSFSKPKSRNHQTTSESTSTPAPAPKSTLIPPRCTPKSKKTVSFTQPSRGYDSSSQHDNSPLAERLGYNSSNMDEAALKRIDSLCSAINFSLDNNYRSHCLGILPEYKYHNTNTRMDP